MRLLDVLPVGRANARTIAELATICGISRRECEEALQAIADDGVLPLVATSTAPYGVYLATTPQELDDYAKRLQQRLVTQYRRIRGVRKAAQRMRDQPVYEPIPLWEVA